VSRRELNSFNSLPPQFHQSSTRDHSRVTRSTVESHLIHFNPCNIRAPTGCATACEVSTRPAPHAPLCPTANANRPNDVRRLTAVVRSAKAHPARAKSSTAKLAQSVSDLAKTIGLVKGINSNPDQGRPVIPCVPLEPSQFDDPQKASFQQRLSRLGSKAPALTEPE
jgi:hypothetical protein